MTKIFKILLNLGKKHAIQNQIKTLIVHCKIAKG